MRNMYTTFIDENLLFVVLECIIVLRKVLRVNKRHAASTI